MFNPLHFSLPPFQKGNWRTLAEIEEKKMSRRRLRLVSSSDEENEEPPPPPQERQEEIDEVIIDDIDANLQTVTINSSNRNDSCATANSNTSGNRRPEQIPIDISDDEGEHYITSGTASNSNFGNVNISSGYFEVSESPVNEILERLGLRLKKEWLNSCLLRLELSVQGFPGLDSAMQAKLCLAQFLRSDMNCCGAGVLPPNVHALHLVDLKGPFVLQVDEIVNMSCPLRGRYQNAAAGAKRSLKLSMTDGVQRVFGMEYRPIKDLEVLAPAGLKVAICNVHIRHGVLMLVPEALEVLGGTVEELEAARRRVINEVNKPPRGKRNRRGVVHPLATRSTLAAWPLCDNAVPGHADNNPIVGMTTQQTSEPGTAVHNPANGVPQQSFANPLGRNNAGPHISAAPCPQQYDEVRRPVNLPSHVPLQVSVRGTPFIGEAINPPKFDSAVLVSSNSPAASSVKPLQSSTMPKPVKVVVPSMATIQVATPGDNNMSRRDVEVLVNMDIAEANASSAVGIETQDIYVVYELEPQFMLSRDNEAPFTYLASLSAKSVAAEDESFAVRGLIKCFLTGVRGFQYKRRNAYELRVYVDDGSLISEILIDHKVVQNGIGYSPHEVTDALVSSDTKRVSAMKETLKQFQIFLVNFEGTMLVEMSKASPVPVAVEMNQGFPASDAWLLLKRLKSPSSTQLDN